MFVKSDTVFTDRVVITPGDSTTVFVPVKEVRDSIITYYKDRIKTQISIRNDTIRVNVECPPDTVKISVPTVVNNEVICPPRNPFWRTVALVLGVILAGFIYFKR